MAKWKLLLFVETLVYLIFSFLLEYFISYPYMFLHHGKDGGLTSEVFFLLIMTMVTSLLWFIRNKLVIIMTLFLSPIMIVISYLFWAFFLRDEGIGFLLAYLFLLTIYKFLLNFYLIKRR